MSYQNYAWQTAFKDWQKANAVIDDFARVLAAIQQFTIGCLLCHKKPNLLLLEPDNEAHMCPDCWGEICWGCCMDNYIQSK